MCDAVVYDGCLRRLSSCRRRRAIFLVVLFVLLGADFLVIGPVRKLADRAAVLDHEAARAVQQILALKSLAAFAAAARVVLQLAFVTQFQTVTGDALSEEANKKFTRVNIVSSVLGLEHHLCQSLRGHMRGIQRPDLHYRNYRRNMHSRVNPIFGALLTMSEKKLRANRSQSRKEKPSFLNLTVNCTHFCGYL